MGSIVRSVRADIDKLKSQLESLPAFPEGRRPPSPLARFTNQVDRIDKELKMRVLPKTSQGTRARTSINSGQTNTLPDIDMQSEGPTQRAIPLHLINKTIRKQMEEQKYSFLTADPENAIGHDMIR